MTYFNACTTQDELKKEFRKLARQFHPDLNPGKELECTEIMKAINSEFAFATAKLAKGENLSSEEINATILENEAYRVAIEKIIHLEGISIEVVGSWIWVTGNTKPYCSAKFGGTGQLGDAGFFFASKKCAWYFRTAENAVKKGGKTTLDQIRTKYGSEKINGKFSSNRNLN